MPLKPLLMNYTKPALQNFLLAYPFNQLSSAALARLSGQFQPLRYHGSNSEKPCLPLLPFLRRPSVCWVCSSDQSPWNPAINQGAVLGWAGLIQGCETVIASTEVLCLTLPADFLAWTSIAATFHNSCALIEVFELLGAELDRRNRVRRCWIKQLALKAWECAVACQLTAR